MSLFRIPKLRSIASKIENLRGGFGRSRKRGAGQCEHRHLLIDPLEERQLLSLAPADWQQMLVNQVVNEDAQSTLSEYVRRLFSPQSVAADNDGDFVVTWTRYDSVVDQNGNPIIDPGTGLPMTEGNIYARYFTDEVQRLTLPDEIAANSLPGQYGWFSLVYGGNEVQKLSITATYEPFSFYQDRISAEFKIGFDVDGDGSISAAETTRDIFFSESSTLEDNAMRIQGELQGLGGALSDATVQGVNPHEYLVKFGNDSGGLNQPELVIDPREVTFTSGFLPAILVSTVREPVELGPIYVSPDDPLQTANAIEQAFFQTSRNFPLGPIDFPPPERVPDWPGWDWPDYYPEAMRAPVPGVTVTPTREFDPATGTWRDSLTQFEITFDGAPGTSEGPAGKTDHPQLVVSAAEDEFGNSLIGSPQLDVETIKEPSPEFRVNPEEPDNPFTPLPDRFNQTGAAVAMDADGDFVITWQSEVPNAVDFGSVTDIFARVFRPVGLVDPAEVDYVVDTDFDGVPDTPIQGVKLLAVQSVQILTFNATVAAPLVGQFQLQVDGNTTDVIDFDSSNLLIVAEDIRDALNEAGYRDVSVRVLSGVHPLYRFEVTFGPGSLGDHDRLDDITMHYVPVALDANVSVAHKSEDLFTFRVNTNTTGVQAQPTVGMDDDGNFVIAWAGGGQDLSFFNSIWAQRYSHDGQPLGAEFRVSAENTSMHFDPFVALSNDGNFVITWTTTDDEDFFVVEPFPDPYLASVLAKVYDPNGQVLLNQFGVGGGGGSSAAFDSGNNFVITRHGTFDSDNIGIGSSGVRAVMRDLSGNIIRDEFRANSSSLNPAGEAPLWPLGQYYPEAALDADGDLVISYQGFGPDVSEDVYTWYDPTGRTRQFLVELFYKPQHADLLPFFDPMWEDLPVSYYMGSIGDVDGAIEPVLVRAMNAGATNEQVGRIRALLDQVAGLLRGEANGVMFSRYDAEPGFGPLNTLFSDSIANVYRDGHNQRYILTIDSNTTGGNLVVRLYHPNRTGFDTVNIAPVYQNSVLQIYRTRDAIQDALRNAPRTGLNWPWPNTGPHEGPVDVRVIQSGFGSYSSEVLARQGTPWDLTGFGITPDDAVFEIVFQGEVHETGMYMYIYQNNLAPDPSRASMFEHTEADFGTGQGAASISMEPDGDFVMVFMQYEEFTDGSTSNQNIYYRRFDERTDTAGPRLVGLMDSDGNRVADGGFINGPVRYVVLTLDEEMLGGDPAVYPDSVLNPGNFKLYYGGVEIPGGVAEVHFGLNKAAELAGQIDPVTGDYYDVSPIPSNKWEAVLVLDGNGGHMPGTPEQEALKAGVYTIEAVAPQPATGAPGLRDKAGNPLGHTGFTIGGQNLSRDFVVVVPQQPDTPIDTPLGGAGTVNATTHPETPGAVAMDADGDYVAVWTAFDPALGHDRVYMRLFDADGSAADLIRVDAAGQPVLDPFGNLVVIQDAAPILPVTPLGTHPELLNDIQRFGSVAMDADGDFVISWTNYHGGDADIYVRRFDAAGELAGVDDLGNVIFKPGASRAFRINEYTDNAQKWSDVAMDVDGDFVVTWSSYDQENGGGTGSGYGIYARRFDSFGQPLAPEFGVNVTTSGDQRLASVCMDAVGGFFVAWTSRQGGVDDEVIGRWFNPDGSPVAGPLAGEILINATTVGAQRYPDAAMDLPGGQVVVTWSSMGQDGSGYGVYARTLQRVGTMGPEFPVNTSTTANQVYSSVAMDHQGAFVITWSGRGDQPFQEDPFGSGVFYQRYDEAGVRLGGETRVNRDLEGDQRISSIGSDGEGNFVIVWTGVGATPGTTTVYHLVSTQLTSVADTDGPIVTDVLTAERNRIFDGDYLQSDPPVSQLIVLFGEDLSTRGGSSGLDSVLNPDNWSLSLGGTEIPGGIHSVQFRRNPISRKYEAVLTLDGNGLGSGVVPLSPGNYVLAALDNINDAYIWDPILDAGNYFLGNALDGDFDGVPGGGYGLGFVVASNPQLGTEFRVNPDETRQYEQRFAAAGGTGFGQEQTTRSVAVDHDGDFVVVWTSYGQDDPSDPNGGGVYLRMYDRNNNPMIDPSTGQPMGEILVNTFTEGHQRNASVAIDADGEFVVAWESEGQDPDGSWGIFARRFNSVGRPLLSDTNRDGVVDYDDMRDTNGDGIIDLNDPREAAPEFRVNTEFTNHQLNPAVAMDDFGNFVVAWATAGQNFSFFNDVHAQRYNNRGVPQGLEFLVNSFDVPGITGFEVNPAAAMTGPTGEFVVAWHQVSAQANGVPTNSVIVARLFGPTGLPVGPEFAAATGNLQRNPQLVMDDLAGFLLVWESGGPANYDVFFQQFNAAGGVVAGGQVNQVQFGGHQVNPSVSVDADGEFAVVWNGNGGQTDPLNPGNPNLWTDLDSEGVFIRRYDASWTPVTVQSRVNRTEAGIQQFPSIGMERDGDLLVVWSGRGVGDQYGVFARRYDEPTDTAGPLLTEVRSADGSMVNPGEPINRPQYLIVTFDEAMWTTGDDSVENVDNWLLTRDFVEVEGAIVRIQYGLNKAAQLAGQIDPLTGEPYGLNPLPTNKYEAVITLDGNPSAPGLTPLMGGSYTLTALHPIPDVPQTPQVEGQSGLRDAVGNPIGRSGLLPSGADASLSFIVRPGGVDPGDGDDPVGYDPVSTLVVNGRTYGENRGAVAVDADGDHIVVLTARDDDPLSASYGLDRVYVRMFNADGTPAATKPSLFPVTTEPEFRNDEQRFATVAADDDGDFVVTWTNYRGGEQDVYARRFSADGAPLGPSFRVNTYTANNQKWSSVAMDVDGDFVVTWSSYGQEGGGLPGAGYGIYARRFDSFGQPLAPEFQVNITTAGDQQFSSIDMTSDGGFVIVWQSDQELGVGDDIFARLFNPDGSTRVGGSLTAELQVNYNTPGDGNTLGNQTHPDVAITPDGNNFVVTWTSAGQDGSGDGVYGQKINVPLLIQGPQPVTFTYINDAPPPPPVPFGFGNTVVSTVTVPSTFPNDFTIADVDVYVDIRHAIARDVELRLIAPSGTYIRLCEQVPVSDPFGSDFINTLFNDEGAMSIKSPLALAPFLNPAGYWPEQALSAFDGQRSSGTWRLVCQDPVDNRVDGQLLGWTLVLTRVPARSGVFRVNTTTAGSQGYSSVSMNHQGAFTVTWSGNGDQPFQEDRSGTGVFYQRYSFGLTPLGGETRVNMETEGNQLLPSIDADGEGNFVIVWTGVGATAGTTDVYRLLSTNLVSVPDVDGPRVTDALLPDRTRVIYGDFRQPGEFINPATGNSELTIVFGEQLSVREGTTGLDSVLNPNNWVLERGGSEISGVITDVSFGWNASSRKWEATLTLDGNGLDSGTPPLPAGDYVLTVTDHINDIYTFDPVADAGIFYLGNALDGDFDGTPGTFPTGTGYQGYKLQFSVADTPQFGPEFRINESPFLVQRFAAALGTGEAREESTRSVAVDHDGDYVVVWTSYGQDDPSDPSGGGVYFRMYDRDGNPMIDPATGLPTGERRVNITTSGQQRNAAVAIDADGEFVIVWESEGQDPDGSWGIYGRRYNSVGQPLGGEFRVNVNTAQNQLNPAVATDDYGNFIVVWATAARDFSFSNDIRGQLFDHLGRRLGGEFLVNAFNLPGVAPPGAGAYEVNPAVAMAGPTGDFVVAWDLVTAQANGVVTDSVIAARVFNASRTPLTAEFQADTGAGLGGGGVFRTARNAQLAMDDQGDFTVVWESFGADDIGPNSYGVFYQQFDVSATGIPPVWTALPVASGQVNHTEFPGEQVNPSVAVDADGNFSIVWNGAGGEFDPLDPLNPELFGDLDDEGVFIRSYDSTGTVVSVESRVNRTEAGIQHFPSIGMERDGARVVVWAGRGVGDQHGIFARRYDEPVDAVGPLVSDLLTPSGRRIQQGGQVTETLSHLVVVFDEEMMTTGPDRVTNPANYRLLRNGSLLAGGIKEIYFGLNESFTRGLPGAAMTNKWEAVIVLDGNGASPGSPPLETGDYELVVRNSVRDRVGNPLGSTGAVPSGAPFSRSFNLLNMQWQVSGETRVNSTPGGGQFTHPYGPQTVADDADGDYVVVWTDETAGREGVYASLYDVVWTETPAGRESTVSEASEILVTDDPTASFASVAMDADGDFVVVWSQFDPVTDLDIYARRYDAAGNALSTAFLVNSETADVQHLASVAMDTDGDFIIVWQSQGQDGSGYGVYAQRYSPAGDPIGGTNEVQMLTFFGRPTGTFRLGFQGRVTGVINFLGNTFDVADDVEAALRAIGADVEVEAINLTNVVIRFVGAQAFQDQEPVTVVDPVLVGDPGAGMTVSTRADGAAGEFLVNDTTENDQVFPCVAMDSEGAIIVTWTSFGQDGDGAEESNVYAKQLVSNDAFRLASGEYGPREYEWDSVSERFPDVELAVSTDDPYNHIVPPGAGFDGVVQLIAPLPWGWFGTGSLLRTGRHILTAAHVVDAGGGIPLPSIDVAFDLPDGRSVVTATQIYIHPDWDGDIYHANDLAIIVLPEQAPVEAERYDIYRGSQELNYEVEMVGYGVAGQTVEQFYDGLKRVEYNVFEVFGEAYNGLSTADFYVGPGTFNIPPGKLLAYDFDSGLPANDTFGALFGKRDLGLGVREGTSSHGDSGGPSFLNGLIIGVTSGIIAYMNTDADPFAFNLSFGETIIHGRVSAYADWIDLLTQTTGSEFLVNQNAVDPITGALLVDNQSDDQKCSTVALDAEGDFVVTWTSYGQDGVGSGYGAGVGGEEGIFARRYDSGANPLNDPFQVNTIGENEQQFSRIAMDADGDFVITWESFQDRPQGGTGSDSPDSFGIYAQRYVRDELIPRVPLLDPTTGLPVLDPITLLPIMVLANNGVLGGEFAVNTTKEGDQRYPGVAMDDTGDFVIVWSGNGQLPGQTDDQGIFQQRLEKLEDDAGPIVADVLAVVTSPAGVELEQLLEENVLEQKVSRMVVSFGEDLNTTGGAGGVNSVLNIDNWQLTRDGQVLFGGVASVQFRLNQALASGITGAPTNKYEAVLTLDGDPTKAGNQPLDRAHYVLTLRDAVLDLFDNALDGDFDGTPGMSFTRTFTILLGTPLLAPPGTPDPDDEDVLVNTTVGFVDPITGLLTPTDQDDPAVARSAEGESVVVWVSEVVLTDPLTGLPLLDPLGNLIIETNIVGQRFSRFGYPLGAEFLVASYTAGSQMDPDVAMDDFGNFVVVWSGEGEDDDSGVFARVFDAFGAHLGDQFQVNQYTVNDQDAPAVAMDANGDFVVTWDSYGQDGDRDGVYARRYSITGRPLSDEFQVNTTSVNRQENSDVAMDADGNFVVIWQSFGQDGSSWGIFGQRYNAAGAKVGGEFPINQYRSDKQIDPRVGMDADGDFVVAWSSYLQDGNGYGVYAQRYSRAGAAQGNQFRVNQTTLHWQQKPAVAMDPEGDFVITWTTFDQEGPTTHDNAIFARMFNSDGSDYVDANTGQPLGEFRVNAFIEGDQVESDVSMDGAGRYVVVWTGPDFDDLGVPAGTGIYSRYVDPAAGEGPVDPGSELILSGTGGNDVLEFFDGDTPGSGVVKLNGVRWPITPQINSIHFDGGGGYDVIVIAGTDAGQAVELWPSAVDYRSTYYAVTANRVETAVVDGRGGSDVAVFNDSDGDDSVIGTPDWVAMQGPGFYHVVARFETAHAYATAGGTDTTYMYDSEGDDTFILTPQYAKLSGDGFLLRAKSFEQAHGYSVNGGTDVAYMYGSTGNDVLLSQPTQVKLYGDGFFGRAKTFSSVYVYGAGGENDVATMLGSNGDDTFTASPTQAEMTGNGFYHYAGQFGSVSAYGGGGANTAMLYGSDADDTFVFTPSGSSLNGEGYGYSIAGFGTVHAYAQGGENDVAYMYDSPADDVFIGQTTYAKLYGPGFSARAKAFDAVHAYATAGGTDTAYLFGSSGDDTLIINGTYSKLYSDTHYNRAKYFELVYALASEGGTDTAVVHDAVLERGLLTTGSIPAEISHVAWLYGFEELQLRNTPPGSDDSVIHAVDEIFTLYWE